MNKDSRTYQRIDKARKALKIAGIEYESQKRGSILIIRHNTITIYFYPVSGIFYTKWKPRQKLKPTDGLRGVDALIKYLGA